MTVTTTAGSSRSHVPCSQTATNTLLKEVPGLTELIEAVYGEGFNLPGERFSARNYPIDREDMRQLRKDAHIDYPGWMKKDGAGLTVKTVSTPPGSVSLVLLYQGGIHSIPKGGTAGSIYFSPKSAGDESEIYIKALVETWQKYCAKAIDPKFDGKKVQFWREAAIKIGPEASPQTIIALSLAFGLPPLIYPSCKPITTSPGYSGSYPHFVGQVAPNPDLQKCDPAEAYKAIAETYPERIAEPFKHILDALPHQKWIINPAKHFTERTLAAFLFFGF